MRRLLLLLTLAAMPLFSHAIEEPDYEVVKKFDPVELRRYALYVVAEVVLDSSAEDAGIQAFPIMAGYIFGKNKGELKVSLEAAGVATQGDPVLARYNAPFTPWFMRRNEIWLALR